MKPKLFIASSIEARKAAAQVAGAIRDWVDSEIWTDGFFHPGGMTAETIERSLRRYDGGLFLLSPDDLLLSRSQIGPLPRANVLFELGMFGGALGLPNCLQLVLKVKPSGWESTMKASSVLPRPYGPLKASAGWTSRPGGTPISDLEGITYVPLEAQIEVSNSRINFGLTAKAVAKLRKLMLRMCLKDRSTWQATIGVPAKELICVWVDGSSRNEQPIQVAVFGDRLRGRYRWTDDGRYYEVALRFDGKQHFSGHWWDPKRVGYAGLAQFQLRHRPPYLLGKWVGWSSNGGVKSGNYLIAAKKALAAAESDANRVWESHTAGDRTRKRAHR